MDYLARLKMAMSWIDTELWPQVELQNDLESLMTRLKEIPGRVQEWKKSSARCGADVALSLVRVHCKEVKEDKLAALKVATPRSSNSSPSWRPSSTLALVLQTASTLIASSSQQALLLPSEQTLCLTFICLRILSYFVSVKLFQA